MLSTVKVYFLDMPGGKRDSCLPVNELRFEKDIFTNDGKLTSEQILQHVYETKLAIQKLYTKSYCDYFRLIYRFGDSTTGTIVTEEYNSTKEVKRLEFKTEEEFEKANVHKEELKERKDIHDNRPKKISKDDLKEIEAVEKIVEPIKDEVSAFEKRKKKEVPPLKQEVIEPTKNVEKNKFEDKYKSMDESVLTKKKLSLQSKRSRLKKEGILLDEIPEIEQEISYINSLIKAKFLYNF